MLFADKPVGSITELRSGKTWTPAEIADAVRHRALFLRSHSVEPGQRVIIRQNGGCSFFADLFATWQLGACAVCVSPQTTAEELEQIAGLVDAAFVLEGSGVFHTRSPIARTGSDAAASSADADALILLTSGTTGRPKAVVHTRDGLLARITLNRQVIGDEALARTLCVLPVHFGHGLIGGCLTALLSGHDLVVASDMGPGILRSLDRVIDDQHITFMTSVPAIWRSIGEYCRRRPARSLTRVHVGSAPLSAALWEQIIDWTGTRDVVNAYGLTEAANWVAGASARRHVPRDGLIGRMWGGRAAVISEDRIAEVGQGELVIQSPSLMRGYYRGDELNREKWRDGWFRTGDLAEIDGDGLMRLKGRLGLEINRGGLKVQPLDIEQTLEQHEQVKEACAFPVADHILGQRVGVAVVLAGDASANLAAVRKWLAARLSREKQPDRWYALPQIPRTERGKVDRAAVERQCIDSRNHRSRTPS